MRIVRRVLCCVLLAVPAFCARADAEPPEDEVPVPGGPAAIRRLLRLDAARPAESFFRDLHESLLAGAEWKAGWSEVERRRAVVDFVKDLDDWRAEFGRTVVLSVSPGDWTRTRRALRWLGVEVRGNGRELRTENRDDARSLRRRAFLDALGVPLDAIVAKLSAGEPVTVAPADESAPIPFGLAAWREMLRDPRYSAAQAFLDLVKNVRA